MATNLQSIKDLLLPGLLQISGKYDTFPQMWKKVFKTKKSDKKFERTPQMRFLSYARVKADGGPTFFDNEAGERYLYTQNNIGVALGFAVTHEAIEDNQYKTEFPLQALNLTESFIQTKETFAADVLNSGTTYDSSIGGDGKALFATDHPIDGGTIANRPTVDADLTESSLLNGMVAINANWRDQAGLRIPAQAKMLVVPSQLEPVAIRLTKTALRPGTGNNDVNAILYTQGGLPDGYMVWNYLTSQYAWFLLTDQDGLQHLDREKYSTKMQTDFNTDNLLVKGYERFSFSYFDWRSAYASFPTS